MKKAFSPASAWIKSVTRAHSISPNDRPSETVGLILSRNAAIQLATQLLAVAYEDDEQKTFVVDGSKKTKVDAGLIRVTGHRDGTITVIRDIDGEVSFT